MKGGKSLNTVEHQWSLLCTISHGSLIGIDMVVSVG